MKRLLILALAALMLLSLAACGESAPAVDPEHETLFTKYEELIRRLEDQDYNAAIQRIAEMAYENTPHEEKTPMNQVLQGEWYAMPTDSKVPQRITVADGTITVDGKAYTWLEEYGGEESLQGWLLDNGAHTYWLSINKRIDQMIPTVTLYTVRQVDGHYQSHDWCGGFVNDAMLPYLMSYWYDMDVTENAPERVSLGEYNARVGEQSELDWTVSASESGKISVEIEGGYTATVELRNEKPILTLSDTNGVLGTYRSDAWGYDKTWPEYIYPYAVEYLNDCLENTGFWSDLDEKSYSGNEARKYVQELFLQLGDYKDSAQLAARVTVLKDMYTKAVINRVDNLGNKTESNHASFTYDAQGRVVKSYVGWDNLRLFGVNSTLSYTYDDTGRANRIQYGDITAIFTPEYDAAGHMVKVTAQYNEGTYEFTYAYDDAGRMISSKSCSSSGMDYSRDYTYTYDAEGKLIQMVGRYNYQGRTRATTDFTYDAQGYLVSRVTVVEDYDSWDKTYDYESTETVTYVNDVQGRPVSAEMITDSTNSGATKYVSQEIVYTYEDLYFVS